MRRKHIILGLLVLLVVVPASVGASQTYVSFKGNFYISYPDDWAQVNYELVDAFLLRNKAGKTILDYDAAFAVKDAPQFFSKAYLILTVDTVGAFTQKQVDSVLKKLSREFGEDVKYYPVADFLTDIKTNTPSYNKQTNTISILSDIIEQGKVIKKHLLVMKFYEKGIANFYFYSPVSTFEENKKVFEQIVSSFSTENVEAALPKETVKVADIEIPDASGQNERQARKKIYLYLGVALLLVILIVLRRHFKKKR